MATAKLTVPILLEWKDIEGYMALHDIVEVVRCKDCKHLERDVIFQDGWCRGRQQGNPNWFCADGERKEDGPVD